METSSPLRPVVAAPEYTEAPKKQILVPGPAYFEIQLSLTALDPIYTLSTSFPYTLLSAH